MLKNAVCARVGTGTGGHGAGGSASNEMCSGAATRHAHSTLERDAFRTLVGVSHSTSL
jgi:hypothetical protein